jgi:hypothetical protein
MNQKLTPDETPTSPLDLCRDDHPTRHVTRPHDTRSRLDRKHIPARHIRRPRRSQGRNVVLKVAMDDLVAELAFRLSRSDGGVEGLDVRHVTSEQFGVSPTVGRGRPI